MTGFHQSPATQRLPATFKVAQTQEDLCTSSSASCLVSHCCLSWHTIYFAGIYILCARSDGRPWSQNSSTAVHQFHRHQIIAANGPQLRMGPWGSSWNRSPEIQYEVLISPDETVDFCTNVWTQRHAAVTHSSLWRRWSQGRRKNKHTDALALSPVNWP